MSNRKRDSSSTRTAQPEDKPDEAHSDGGESQDSGRGNGGEAPIWEWIVAGVGLLLVAGSMAFMLYQGVAGDNSPPEINLRVESIVPVQGGFLVQFRATNIGGSTVADLNVEGELRRGGDTIETSDTTLDYVPSHSNKQGGLFFKEDPGQFELQLRPLGYQEP